ncbi:metal ABC transporter ATP-binding protein [Acetobacter conturbans]|uniref:ATP-binding cassette domain-containing protein n=1 Tax=Acetobacter conturbans TaxID=1737472 RepID=A0ABX0JY51_9PROT|nr:ATP-binding cassette domain-containing protein [Acetobacter conturbans]NHN88411.1 ATP-binding cassette domain-containing protein [Acetobacter conturbans]
MAEPAVTCENVMLSRGERDILSGVSLSVPEGCFVGLFGPNGGGKTTLLRALLGLQPVARGRITVLGDAPGACSAQIGYMPQSRGGNGASLTGWDLLGSGMSGNRWGIPWRSRADTLAIREALDAVDATALADRRLGALSGGERQRLLIAQALIGWPRLLLLDEPLASLDPVRMRDVAERLGRIAKQRGMTVICSAHDINALMGVMDSVLYVARGQARLGTVDEVMTTEGLSALYGAPVEVCRAPSGRLLVSADAL